MALVLNAFRKSVSEEQFASSAAFQKHVVYAPLDCGVLEDSPALRALLALMHYGPVQTHRCSKCRGKAVLLQRRTPKELKWVCDNKRNQLHWKAPAVAPPLHFLRSGS